MQLYFMKMWNLWLLLVLVTIVNVMGAHSPQLGASSRTTGSSGLVATSPRPRSRGHSPKPHLGSAVKVYGVYGKLNEDMMNVIHRATSDTWTFWPSFVKVFKNVSAVPKNNLHAHPHVTFAHRDVKLKLCRNVDDLMINYFSFFDFEGIKKPWQALMSDWSTTAIAERFGIKASYLKDENYSYALLKIKKIHDHGKISGSPDDLALKKSTAKSVQALSFGNVFNLVTLMMQIGSHYITYWATGDSLYQVFVFKSSSYLSLEIELSKRNLSELSTAEFSDLFSPKHAAQVGKILSASGNLTVEAWAAEHFRGPERQSSYASLAWLHNDETLRKEVGNVLKDEALLGLHLKILTPLFKDSVTRNWFEGYINEYLSDIQS